MSLTTHGLVSLLCFILCEALVSEFQFVIDLIESVSLYSELYE